MLSDSTQYFRLSIIFINHNQGKNILQILFFFLYYCTHIAYDPQDRREKKNFSKAKKKKKEKDDRLYG
jgi:hypothetical protein